MAEASQPASFDSIVERIGVALGTRSQPDTVSADTPSEAPPEEVPEEGLAASGDGDGSGEAQASAEDASEPEGEAPSESEAAEAELSGGEEEKSQTHASAEGTPLAELAKASDMDVDEFASQVLVEGPDGAVPLQVVLESFKAQPEIATAREELKIAQHDLEQKSQQFEQQATPRLEALEVAIKTTLEVFKSDAQRVAALKDTDFEQYMRESEDLRAREASLNDALTAFEQEKQVRAAEEQQKRQEQTRRGLLELQKAIPAWRTRDGLETGLKEIAKGMAERYGFSAEDLNQINDPRLILMARDAIHGRAMQDKVDPAKKQLKSLPKIPKPGARKNPDSPQRKARKEFDAKRDRLRQTGKIDDFAEMLKSTGGRF